MGLDTTHDAFHGAYSSFMRFRSELLTLTNKKNIRGMYGFGGDDDLSEISDIGIKRLINQSDCDGKISPKDCKLISDSLDKYIPMMELDSELYRRSVQFRNGCLMAYINNETLDFG